MLLYEVFVMEMARRIYLKFLHMFLHFELINTNKRSEVSNTQKKKQRVYTHKKSLIKGGGNKKKKRSA